MRIYLTEYERDAIRPRVLGKFRDLLRCDGAQPGDALLSRQLAERRARRRRHHGGCPTQPRLHAPPHARPGPRPAKRPAAAAGSRHARPADARRSGDAAAAAQPGHQRELRPRADGAAHARRRRRLHAEGRAGSRAGVHGLDDRQPAARRRIPLRSAPARRWREDRAGPAHQGGRRPEATATPILDLLARHPSTARFIATKLARRFVADDPPAALVDRAARTLQGHRRRHPRGRAHDRHLTGVLRADGYRRAKIKNPFEFVVSAVRATGLDISNALPLVQSLRDLGMPLYGCQPPTGYADRADAWVNSGALLNRMNFAVALTSGRMRTLGATAPATPPTARGRAAGAAPGRARRRRQRVDRRNGGESNDAGADNGADSRLAGIPETVGAR